MVQKGSNTSRYISRLQHQMTLLANRVDAKDGTIEFFKMCSHPRYNDLQIRRAFSRTSSKYDTPQYNTDLIVLLMKLHRFWILISFLMEREIYQVVERKMRKQPTLGQSTLRLLSVSRLSSSVKGAIYSKSASCDPHGLTIFAIFQFVLRKAHEQSRFVRQNLTVIEALPQD